MASVSSLLQIDTSDEYKTRALKLFEEANEDMTANFPSKNPEDTDEIYKARILVFFAKAYDKFAHKLVNEKSISLTGFNLIDHVPVESDNVLHSASVNLQKIRHMKCLTHELPINLKNVLDSNMAEEPAKMGKGSEGSQHPR